MVLALLRQRIGNWQHWHYYFMNWSVVGLYAAFWAETITRTLPIAQFWPAVVGATTATATLGAILIRRNAARLLAQAEPARTQPSAGVASEATQRSPRRKHPARAPLCLLVRLHAKRLQPAGLEALNQQGRQQG
ncbi:hypothetical protein [Hymenobacter sp. CRA2]|uniref:hypothetical protein n=1 Tax=Hymenobacter sp. CRA2 TaxID=1955620 RepID=UPI00098F86D5|nr:hypothetical protein [Hymenobacter sp. CRA2]OON70181.1 hypothetical protein B0919_05455 [Hymenobacter sp. CRA2]